MTVIVLHVGKFELVMKTEVELKRILCFLSTDSSSTSSLVGSPSHVVPPDGNGANLSGTGDIKRFFHRDNDKCYDSRVKENAHFVQI